MVFANLFTRFISFVLSSTILCNREISALQQPKINTSKVMCTVFECRRVIGFDSLRYMIGSKNSRYFFIQSQVKPNLIVNRSHAFSRALRQDWLKKLAPLFHPITRKTKTNHNSLARVFPLFASWLAKKLAPLFHPITSKTKSNRNSLERVFPRFSSASCLIGSLNRLCPLWLAREARVITWVLV